MNKKRAITALKEVGKFWLIVLCVSILLMLWVISDKHPAISLCIGIPLISIVLFWFKYNE